MKKMLKKSLKNIWKKYLNFFNNFFPVRERKKTGKNRPTGFQIWNFHFWILIRKKKKTAGFAADIKNRFKYVFRNMTEGLTKVHSVQIWRHIWTRKFFLAKTAKKFFRHISLGSICLDLALKNNFPNINSIMLYELENDLLIEAKQNRTLVEYYWTLTPFFIKYLFENKTNIDFLTYLDADLFFFSKIVFSFLQ